MSQVPLAAVAVKASDDVKKTGSCVVCVSCVQPQLAAACGYNTGVCIVSASAGRLRCAMCSVPCTGKCSAALKAADSCWGQH
jgi:hypothetical protein